MGATTTYASPRAGSPDLPRHSQRQYFYDHGDFPGVATENSPRSWPQRNWPAEVSGSLSHTTATISSGLITAQPVSRSRRTRPSARTSTAVSFLFSVVTRPMLPDLLMTMKIDPDLPISGSSRSRIVSPVISPSPPDI